jgi:hypothetical protein
LTAHAIDTICGPLRTVRATNVPTLATVVDVDVSADLAAIDASITVAIAVSVITFDGAFRPTTDSRTVFRGANRIFAATAVVRIGPQIDFATVVLAKITVSVVGVAALIWLVSLDQTVPVHALGRGVLRVTLHSATTTML